MKTFIRTQVTHHPKLSKNEGIPETLNLKFENWDSPRQICAFCPGMRTFPERWHFSANTEIVGLPDLFSCPLRPPVTT